MRRFHLAISVGVVSIWVVAWFVLFWLVGKAPFMPQVAWADQIAQVTQRIDTISRDNSRIWAKLTDIQTLQLRASIEQQLKNSCLAKRAHNQSDLDNANQQLNQMADIYVQLAGRPFTMPSCNTILVDGK